MWNPDALNGWEADDDLLSWRSFDTAVDAEAKTALVDGRVPVDVFNEAALESASCTAKSEQGRQWTNAAEVFPVPTKVPVLKQFRLDTKCTIGKSPHHASERKVLEWEGQSDATWTWKSRKVANRVQLQRHEGYNEPQELPSTSEMVRIEEQGDLERNPILEWPQVTGHEADGLELQMNRAPASSSNGTLHIHPIQQDPLASDVYSWSSSVFPMDGLAPEWPTDEPSRIQYQDKASPETQVYQTRLPEKDAPISLSDFLTRKQDAEGHREELEAQQRHFMRLATELDESEDKVYVLALLAEEKTWKEKVTHLENQLEHLQIVVVENANKADQDAQIHVQQSSELAQLRAKCQALQDANEDLQDQAKKAITERDRVQKDYSQVVYELGKTQKQLNTISQEKTSVAEKAFLVREIEQLQTDNEQLREKLKAAELMNLHTEARLIKVEQSGLKTMSSRTERERLDGRLQALRLDISRLKSNLR
ncbi:hypothetical protein BBJ28_00015116 [Nothophytophthora sp. Chile5]|nr:hypothetical protein BBJ28_00015116 [Nothophytophthora sp. Chile5]